MCGGHGAAEPGVPGPRGGHPAPGTRHQARATILDDGGDEGQQVRRNIFVAAYQVGVNPYSVTEFNTFCRDDLLKIYRTYIVLQAIPIDGAAQDLQRGLPGDQLCRPPGARPSQAR